MLEQVITSATTSVSNLATMGVSWWQQSACAYPFVQEWIGYCPQPSLCDYLPSGLNSLCQIAVDTASPYADFVGLNTALYGTLMLACTYVVWQNYQTELALDNEQQAQVTKEILEMLKGLQKKVEALNDKIDSLTPEQTEVKIDKIKRARNLLEAYMKQAHVSDISYGDRIREMGIELLEKRAQGESLFHDDLAAREEKRLGKKMEDKAKEQEKRRKDKGPAFTLHQVKASKVQAAPSESQKEKLFQEIKSYKK